MVSEAVRFRRWAFCLSVTTQLFLAAAANGASLRAVGVLGNSGEAGERLVRAALPGFDRSASGVALDGDHTLWASGGDAINRLSLSGSLVERFPLEPAGSTVDSRTFAVLGRRLYFLGRLPDGRMSLFGLDMTGEAGGVAEAISVELPPKRRDWIPYCLSPQPLDGRLLILAELPDPEQALGVYWVDPESPGPDAVRLLFSVPGEQPGGIAVDLGRRAIIIGGYFGSYVGGETHGSVFGITAVNPDGTPVPGEYPAPCTKTPAIPTQFKGIISLAGGALWDTAWYGFLSRLDLRGRGAPGRVMEWHHELGYPTQVLGVGEDLPGGGLLAITTAMPDALYLARWRGDQQQLALVRRIGCLPQISSLGLSPDGLATVGTARAQLWWRWEDPSWAPPRKAELHIAVTPVHWAADRFLALAAQYRLDDLRTRAPVATVFSATVGNRNEATRVSDPAPVRQPTGLSVQAVPGRNDGTLFVTVAASGQLYKAPVWLPDLRPDLTRWESVAVEGEPLQSPTDVVALTDGRLLVAERGGVTMLEPVGGGFRRAQTFRGWGEGKGDSLGGELRLAVDGPWALLSDTERHRVLWVDWTTWEVLGQLGVTDEPGDEPQRLSRPGQVALSGTRALVADTGNQRVVKVELQVE